MAPVIVCVVLTGMPPKTAIKRVAAPAVSAEKPPTGFSLVEPLAHGAHNSPSTAQGSETHGGVTTEDDPDRNFVRSVELKLAATSTIAMMPMVF